MEKLIRYNRWIFQKFEPFLGRRILEIGAGVGNITEFLLDRDFIIATDVEPQYISHLKNTFGKYKKFMIANLDVLRSEAEWYWPHHIDSIVCFNVLEHIEEDEKALKNMFEILQPGGRLLMLVPSHRWLYGSLDHHLGHHRRYGKEELKNKLESTGFKVLRLGYFNRMGILGWFLNGKILRRVNLPSFQLKVYDLFVPFFKVVDLLPLPFGTSLIAIAERPED